MSLSHVICLEFGGNANSPNQTTKVGVIGGLAGFFVPFFDRVSSDSYGRVFERGLGQFHSVICCVFWVRYPCHRPSSTIHWREEIATGFHGQFIDASQDLPAMGAKQKGGSSKPKGNQAEEVEETLQAVVLADTFETRFEPFTLDRPRVRCVKRGARLVDLL